MDLTRPDWDEYFLAGAAWVATRANCRRRKVGSIIAKDHRLVSAGYNGSAAGRPGCLEGACPRGLLRYDEVAALADYNQGAGMCTAVHAEPNAIIHGEYDRIVGATMYITMQPCFGCQKLILGARLARVVWPGNEWDTSQPFPV